LVLIGTNQLMVGIQFCQTNPDFIPEALLFGACFAVGQMIILFGLKIFNSLVLVTITTTRKFATIILSVILYKHSLSFFQWIGVSMVFGGLFIDMFSAYQKHRMVQRSEKLNPQSDSPSIELKSIGNRDEPSQTDAEGITAQSILNHDSPSSASLDDEENETTKLLSKRV
jgi:hypothetical protein